MSSSVVAMEAAMSSLGVTRRPADLDLATLLVQGPGDIDLVELIKPEMIRTEEEAHDGDRDAAMREQGEEEEEDLASFRSRCNTWPRRQQLSSGKATRQQQQQQQQQEQQQPYPSPCGPLPLVSEEEATTMDSTTTAASAAATAAAEMETKEEEVQTQQQTQQTPYSPNMARSSPSVSSPASSSAPKTGSRRNPWGNLSYADLITQAIQSAPDQRLTLAQIYEWLVKNVPYFSAKSDSVSSIGWKNSIRHNLSLHNRFVRVQNEGAGKSSWWILNPEAPMKQAGQSSKHHHHHHHHGPTRRRANTLDTARFEQKRRNRNSSSSNSSSSSSANATAAVAGLGLGPKRLSKSRDQLKRTSSTNSVLVDLPIPAVLATSSPSATAASSASPDHVLSAAAAGPASSPPSGLPRGSPDQFSGPFRARTSSNASSCGRLSPFRQRTLSNASSCCNDLHASPPSVVAAAATNDPDAALSPWNQNQHVSPTSTFGYGDVGQQQHTALGEALRKIKLEEQQQEQQPQVPDSQLSEEDRASLRLLDMTLNAEASQQLMDALCASEEASGILQSIKQEQQLSQDQLALHSAAKEPPPPTQLQQQQPSPAPIVPEVLGIKDEKEEAVNSVLLETFGLTSEQMSQQQPQSPSAQVRDGNKIKILEQRDLGSNGNFHGEQEQQQQQFGSSGGGLSLVQALTSVPSLHHLHARPRNHHHHLLFSHHHVIRGSKQRPLRYPHALRQQLQQQLKQQQQQLELQQLQLQQQQNMVFSVEAQQQQQQMSSPPRVPAAGSPVSFLPTPVVGPSAAVNPFSTSPSGGLVVTTNPASPAAAGGNSGVTPLTPVSESAGEDANISAPPNAYYEDFLRFAQEQQEVQQQQHQQGQEQEQPFQQEQQQQQQQQQQRGYVDDDDDDSNLLFQTLVDPVSVGGFSSTSPGGPTATTGTLTLETF